MLQRFATKQDLIEAYKTHYAHECLRVGYEGSGSTFREIREACFCEPKYTPHIYNGGWFIKSFGYSTERLGRLPEGKARKNLEAMS